MRIIHVTPTYFDEASVIGGGERYVAELAKAQADLPDCEVFVFSFGPKAASFRREGVDYRIFRAAQWKHFTLTNPFAMHHFLPLRRASVIHVHQLCTFVSDMAALAGRFWRIPVFGTDHGGGGAWVLNRKLPVYTHYRNVIGQSDMAASLLENYFPGRVETIPGGVDIRRFMPGHTAAGKQRDILFVGRLLPHKGIDTLVDAFLKWNNQGWKLRVVGRPHDEAFLNELRKRAGDAPVTFESGLNDTELIKAYQSASVTVIPSRAKLDSSAPPELMGFTVLESQACGTPVICSDAGPMREFIREGETGWVFPAGDAEALAKCLEEAAQAADKTDINLSDKCRSIVEKFSWDKVAQRHVRLYASLP